VTTLSLILSDISTARKLGARHIQFTVTADELERLEADLVGYDAGRILLTVPDAKQKQDGAVHVLDGCPIYLGTAYSYSWK